MSFKITISGNGGTMIRVEGKLTDTAANELGEQFQRAEKPVRLELSGLIAADEAGIRALKELSSRGATLLGASPYVRQLLETVTSNGLPEKEKSK